MYKKCILLWIVHARRLTATVLRCCQTQNSLSQELRGLLLPPLFHAHAPRAFTHQRCPRGAPVWDYTLQMGRYLKADASFPEAICTVYNQICFNDDGSDNISNTCSSRTKYYTVVWEMKFQFWQCTWWRCARGGCALLLVRVMNQMAVSGTPLMSERLNWHWRWQVNARY